METARVRSLESNLALKQAAIDRGQGLIEHGFISQGRMDQLLHH
ncbi:MAG: hypothetical protein UY77_C0019G0011 [Candidatus Uhrbacteria bacterium GW2011_GWA2_53_10]|uniref:Uncharacterized protein n=1 Tax=Candidatus Uhrbacteria bacterium GW2011_GWA2_53_10 TaxID=1618980 RepID=A0A0G1ZW16_9BACT|nr:MAG: hypothetical protein UY77_C0019G0011 [Candidatus Uhrbacteria bacterium GW2011_GWA2_53_10]